MELKATRSPKVYLIGDNADCTTRFKLALREAWPTEHEAKCLNRTEFDQLSDDDLENGKFVFVIPSSPRYIIYDEDHPTRSFHNQINKADMPHDQGRGGAFIVVYTNEDGEQSETQSISEEVRRLYRAGSQIALARFAEQGRIISLPDGKTLNSKQIDDIKRFMTTFPEETSLDQARQDEFEALRQLSTDLGCLLDSEFSDVVLAVEGDEKPVPALKAILRARSLVFKEKLESAMGDSEQRQEQGGLVELEIAASSTVTRALVQWMATARLDLDDYDITDICKLLVLADEYKQERLKKLCERKITEKIKSETVLTVLLCIDKEVSERVYAICINFVVRNVTQIMTQPEYHELSKEHFKDLFEFVAMRDKSLAC